MCKIWTANIVTFKTCTKYEYSSLDGAVITDFSPIFFLFIIILFLVVFVYTCSLLSLLTSFKCLFYG